MLRFFKRLRLSRQLSRLPTSIAVKVSRPTSHAVFHFASAKVMQERSPLLVFFEIFSHVLGKQNVSGVATIHHPLRHVDARRRRYWSRPLTSVTSLTGPL